MNSVKKNKKINFMRTAACFIAALTAAVFLSLAAGGVSRAAGVDINSANFEKLIEIDGISEVTAAKIIKYRRENNGFKTVYDLLKVDGVTGELFETIKDEITAGAPSGGPRPAVGPKPQAGQEPPGEEDEGEEEDQDPPAASDRMADPDETGGSPPAPGVYGQPSAGAAVPARGSGRIASEDDGSGPGTGTSGGPAPHETDYSFEEGRKTSEARKAEGASGGGLRSSRIGEIKKISLTPENYYKVIIGLMRLAKYEKAESNIADFVKKFPSDKKSDDMNYLMGACLEESEKYKEAIELYEKVHGNQNSELRAIALFRIGVCFDLMGKSADALDNYRKYVSSFPSSSCVKEAENRIEEMLKTK
jgi:competence ComEA-like helix-hairpin-helix protein